MGVAMLASSLGLSVDDAKGLKRTFFDAFPKLGRFGEQLKQRCREVLIALDCQ
jgi:DNA polymerase I-like protein with 3'-5' exonuclease and polymerase domains